jgi:hypothetical protein
MQNRWSPEVNGKLRPCREDHENGEIGAACANFLVLAAAPLRFR